MIETRSAALEQARRELAETELQTAALLADARRRAWVRATELREQILGEAVVQMRARELVAEAELAYLVGSAQALRDYQAAQLVTAALGLTPPVRTGHRRRAV